MGWPYGVACPDSSGDWQVCALPPMQGGCSQKVGHRVGHFGRSWPLEARTRANIGAGSMRLRRASPGRAKMGSPRPASNIRIRPHGSHTWRADVLPNPRVVPVRPNPEGPPQSCLTLPLPPVFPKIGYVWGGGQLRGRLSEGRSGGGGVRKYGPERRRGAQNSAGTGLTRLGFGRTSALAAPLDAEFRPPRRLLQVRALGGRCRPMFEEPSPPAFNLPPEGPAIELAPKTHPAPKDLCSSKLSGFGAGYLSRSLMSSGPHGLPTDPVAAVRHVDSKFGAPSECSPGSPG